MNKNFKVTYKNGKTYDFEEGTTFKEIAERFKDDYRYSILAARIDNDLVDLSETLKKKCNLEFLDRSDPVGNTIYTNSSIFILILAVKNLLGSSANVIIHHSLDHGVYCTIENVKVIKSTIDKIYDEMKNVVSDNYLFTKISVYRLDAIKYFKKLKKYDKVNLLKYISNTYINLYRINDQYDYFHSKMAYSTSDIDEFKLTYIKDNGFVLSVPDIVNPDKTLDYVHHPKILDEFTEYEIWGDNLGIQNASDLNRIVSKAKTRELINISEAHYDSQLASIAEEIKNSKNNIKVVLIAGPSSSGKTTTSKKLDIYLRNKGFITHPIELDNYYLDLSKRPLDEYGRPDLESVNALDINLFNKNLSDLLKGKKVNMPTYNFILGKKEYNGNYLELGENDIIIVEGLHALNPILTKLIKDDQKYKIFISPLTQINMDDHNYIHTSDVRKLRRIVRDSKTRGYGALDTLKAWPSVKAGERENIFKFQDNVDKVINSSLIYELGVLKTYVEPLLFNVSESDLEYPEALRLINLLRNFLPIPSDDVPKDSVLREFIGDSCFKD